MEKKRKAGLILLIVGLIIFSIFLSIIVSMSAPDVNVWAWEFSGMTGMLLVPVFVFWYIGIILMIIGLLCLVVATLHKEKVS
ncbi:MAG: hypothetical protein ACFFCV_06280 [Promethearchaeota archaeon]